MREIKFRAWDSVNHKIVTSGLAINLDTTGRVIPVSFSQGDLSYCRDNDVNKVPNVANEIQLMQYTGLKDRHGVEIYEGDILQGVEGLYEVKWNNNTLNWVAYDGGNLGLWAFNEPEVIGNIYEHGHLLEANQ